MNENEKRTAGLSVLLPLIFGGAAYYLFCPDVAFVRAIDGFIGRGFHIEVHNTNYALKVFRYYFFDLIWAYALTGALFFICDIRKACIYAVALGLILEVLQKFNMIPGTGDYFDIIAEILGVVLANYLMRMEEQNEKEN